MFQTRVSLTLIVLLSAPAHDLRIHKKWRQDIQRTELLMTFLVHRHGDRTPLEEEIQYSNNPQKLMKLSEPYGLGQLDEAGKVRSYKLGKFLRRRYNKFLSTNLSNVYNRCTNFTRTIMTARIAITAAYSEEKEWRDGMELTPFKCQVVPNKYDCNLALANCPRYMKYFISSVLSDPEAMQPFHRVTEELTTELNFNLTKFPVALYPLYTVYDAELSLGLPLGPVAQAVLPKIAEGAKAAIDVLYGNENYVSLQAGVLLKEFFDKAEQVIAGDITPRMRLYSAHDFNVFSFVAVSGATPRQGVPDFCSLFALELRMVKKTGQYVVLPVYVSTPGEPEKYLRIKGCSGILCDFDEFKRLNAQKVINIHQYRKRCNFIEDMVA